MSRFSIRCDDYDEEYGVVINNGVEYRNTFNIVCDEIEDNNSFTLFCYGDNGMTINRDRCKLNVYIEENKTQYDKHYNIICTHADDSNVYVTIKITQEASTFSISLKLSEEENEGKLKTIQLKSEIEEGSKEGDDMFYEEIPVQIIVNGGSEKYRIANILKIHNEEYENKEVSETIEQILEYDNGFILKRRKDGIIIKNYGRPFSDENDYYVIRIQHFDNRDENAEIKVVYSTSSENNSTDNNTNSTVNFIQTSNIYKIKSQNEQTTTSLRASIKQPKFSINFKEDISNYTIYNQAEEIILPFTVKEGRKISDLMCKVSSSAYWCRVNIIEEYNEKDKIERKLIFKIINKPIVERNALIKVSIIDKPEIFVEFILTNKPSEE